MLRPRAVVLVTLTMVVAACGSSDSSSTGAGGSIGADAGDSSAGGTAGAAGAGGLAGSAGKVGTGGTAGVGGNSAGSGGVAGSTAGSAGIGGSSAGSAGVGGGAAGTAGAGGGGGATGSPRCDPLCDRLSTSGCESAPTKKGCQLTCLALTASDSCDPKSDAYFDCAEAATIECNGQGEAVAKGCGLHYLAAVDCAVKADPNPAMVGPCNTYCDKVVAAACPQNGTKEECNTNCLWWGTEGIGCDQQWGTFLTCANGANMTCVLGYAAAAGCGQEFKAYKACVDAAGGT